MSIQIKNVNQGTSEKQIEAYLVKQIKLLGGVAYKFTSPQRRAVPDRLCILPTGMCIFVECKALNGQPTKAQVQEIKKLVELNHIVKVVNSYDFVDKLVVDIKTAIEMNIRASEERKLQAAIEKESDMQEENRPTDPQTLEYKV